MRKDNLQIFKLQKNAQFAGNRSTQVITLQVTVEDRSAFPLNNKQIRLPSYQIKHNDVTT
jgi:hypothetical protein